MFHMKQFKLSLLCSLAWGCALFCCAAAFANTPQPWQLGFQKAATPTMEHIENLHNFLMIIISLIAFFVIALLGYIIWRFRASKNKIPSKVSHNPVLEVIWTIIPVIILTVIAFPSFRLMFYLDKISDPEITIKISGNAWYWNYEYPEHGLQFDSQIIADKDLQEDQIRLLSVDNQLVVPVDTNIRLLFTSNDVIHSWGVPAFGVKKDCIPGRLNESWIRVTRPGIFYGQCYELCGMNHGFMPIAVKAVSKEEFKQWLAQSQKGS